MDLYLDAGKRKVGISASLVYVYVYISFSGERNATQESFLTTMD